MADKTQGGTQTKLSDSNFIAVAAILSVLALVIAFIIGRDLAAKVRLNAKVIDKKTQARDTLRENIKNGRKLVEEHKSMGPKAKLIINSLPAKADYSGMSNILEKVASESRMRFKAISAQLSSETEESPVQPTPVRFEGQIEGDYAALFRFLEGMEVSSRPSRVVGIQFTGQTPAVKGIMTIETYFQGKAKPLEIKTEEVK
jgi:Tfp pilus assembly protein PilO